ncbi:lysostaphin resistance A-like protein [Desulfosporosinus fructosivorans]
MPKLKIVVKIVIICLISSVVFFIVDGIDKYITYKDLILTLGFISFLPNLKKPINPVLLLILFLLIVYFPDVYLEIGEFSVTTAFLGISVTILMFLSPFFIGKLFRNKLSLNRSLLIYYLLITSTFFLFEPILHIEDTKRFLYFSFSPTIFIYLVCIPWILSLNYLDGKDSFFIFEKIQFKKSYKLILLGFTPSLLIFLINFLIGFESKSFSLINIIVTFINFLIIAFQEEVFYRGFIFNLFRNTTNDTKAIIYTTVSFTLIHWSSYIGQPFFPSLISMIIIGFTGYIFTILYYKGKNLWLPIAFHLLYNLVIAFTSSIPY